MNVKALLFLLLFAPPALAQGFAGLGTDAEGFAIPERGRALQFPRDHGAHPDYRIEWWYLTATLQGADGRDYGAQWTLFRSALAPGEAEGWDSPQVWMGHAGLTTPDQHFSVERFARGGIGQAGAQANPFTAWIDEWHITSTARDGADAYSALSIAATGRDFSYDLKMRAQGPLVLHGDNGYSVKSAAGQASYYYSQPFYTVEGTLNLPDGPVAVTGQAWLDREWSSQPLASDQTGWDWFSIVLQDGHRLMGFRLRGDQTFTAGTWITPEGEATALPDGALSFTPQGKAQVAGRDIPVRWQIDWPEQGLALQTEPVNPQAWMDLTVSYWEGPIVVSGSHQGRGYLEMTGY